MAKVQHTCTGCVPIDSSILETYIALQNAIASSQSAASTAADAAAAANGAAASANGAATAANNAALSANAAAAAANAAGITQAEASVDANTGVPSVDVSLVNKKLTLAFHNVKGEKGDKGDRGDGAVPIVNDLTTGGTDAALSAEMGKTLNNTKQANLVSGTNIKTVNGESLLGSGNIVAGDPNAVKYTEQTLTDAQKAQARTNIGAGTGTYTKAAAGIPKTDLESGVQASLDLADTAIQARPSGEVDPTITPAEYATQEELSQLDQEIINKFSDEPETITSARWESIYFTIASDVWTAVTGTIGSRYFSIKKGQILTIQANSLRKTQWAFLSSAPTNIQDGDTPAYADAVGLRSIDANNTETAVAPSDCWVYVRYRSATSTNSSFPQSITVFSPWSKIAEWDALEEPVESNTIAIEGIYGKVTELTPAIYLNNANLNDDGTINTGATGYAISVPIAVKKGQKITLNSYIPQNGCGLVLTNASSSYYTPVITNSGTGKVLTREYIAPEDCYVAWCYTTAQTYKLYISSAVDIYAASVAKEMVDETFGKVNQLNPTIKEDDKIIRDDGTVETSTHYHISFPIAVKRGQKVKIHSYIAKNFCGLALTDATSSFYTPVITNSENGKVLTREYVAPNDCFVAWCYIDSQTYEIFISAAVNMLEMYEAIAPKEDAGILDFNPNIEFVPKFIAAKKQTNGVSPLVLQVFSDIHAQAPKNLPRILEFHEVHKARIDEIINLGDMVSNQFSNTFSFGDIEGAENILSIIGNHDTATYSGGVYDWTAHAGLDAYEKFIAPFVENWGVTQPEDALENGYCYYYKDYETQDIRIVFLDVMGYDATQEAWLTDVLADAKTSGLSVLIAAHYPSAAATGFEGKYSLLVDNVFNRAAYNPTFYGAVNIVESFISGGGKFISWLTGHRHDDFIGKLDGTNQVCLTVDTAQFGSNSSSNEYDKVEGTSTQDAFSIVCIDTQAKTLSTFKVGCRRDKWQRTRDSVCVNYETATVLCEN